MKKILVAGLPGSGNTLITKNLAKHLSNLNQKILIQDLSSTQKIFNTFKVNKIDEKIGITDYEGIDISSKKEWPAFEKYDFFITDFTIGCEFQKLTKEVFSQYDHSIIILSDDQRAEITKEFITENNLSDVKIIVNLASLIGSVVDFSENINYISYLELDPIVHALDRQGDVKGKILFEKMPKEFRRHIEGLSAEVFDKEKLISIRKKQNKIFKKIFKKQAEGVISYEN